MDDNPKRVMQYFKDAAPVVAFRLSNGRGVESYRTIRPEIEALLPKELTPSREKRGEGIDGFEVGQAWMREDKGLVPHATEFTPWADTPGEDDQEAQVHFDCLTQRENRAVYLKGLCKCSFKRIGVDLGLSTDNARQIFCRAKKKLDAQRKTVTFFAKDKS